MSNYNLWYNALFENANEGIIRFNKEHIVLDVNQRFIDLFEFSKDEIIGRDIDDIFDSAKKNSANRFLTNKLLEGIISNDKDYRYSKSGRKICCIIQGIPIHSKDELIGGYAMYLDISELEATKEILTEERIKYSELVEQMNEGLILHNTKEEFIYANQAAAKIFEMPAQDLIGKTIKDFIPERFYPFIDQQTEMRKKNITGAYHLKIKTPNDRYKILDVKAKPISLDYSNNEKHIYATFSDITDQYNAQERIRQSEKKYRTLVQSMDKGLALCEVFNDDFTIIEINPKFEEIFGYNRKDILNKSGREILRNNYHRFLKAYKKINQNPTKNQFKYFDEKREKFIQCSIFKPQGNHFGVLIKDVTYEEKIKEKIEYLTYHDKLTGLYNRAYLEEKMKEINAHDTIGIIMGDANALKLINDVYNHDFGDELLIRISEKLVESIRDNGVVARWGGDEFLIFLPQTKAHQLEKILIQLKKAFQKEAINGIPVSLSLGSSLGNIQVNTVSELINIAEEEMYNNKLINSASVKKEILTNIFDQLIEKNYETFDHIDGMEKYLSKFAEILELKPTQIVRLINAAKFHDIGKIVVPENIIKKSGPLSPLEWDIVKKHPVSSYRILKSTDEYSFISTIVLHHHEWWNGKGYPGALVGEDIPLLSRILGIVEAYDVMIHDQPYKKKISKKEAIDELKRYSGIQFDPNLVKLFIERILN
jgi:diguanylate cyclase (GGDEF)-like protein/PAS domain S-box-containing protein